MPAISFDGVTKQFDGVTAVNGLDLTVNEGEVFGFLGPNGAGKTTTIDLILDFIRPTSGDITVFDLPVTTEARAIRKRTGMLPEGADVWNRLTGRQHLEFAIESKGVDDSPAALLDRVGIPDAGDRKAGDYSKGMRQRLLLAMALVGEPDLLILDEPSTGLDPNGARQMREIVREERDRGATVFFSSHILEQVEAVCDRVGIMNHGSLVALDTVDGLRDSVDAASALRVRVDRAPESVLDSLRTLDDVEHVAITKSGETPIIDIRSTGSKTTILEQLESDGIEVLDFRTEQSSLDDVFAAYTETEASLT